MTSVRELTDLPAPDANISSGVLLWAGDTESAFVYECGVSPAIKYCAVLFTGCRWCTAGGPNDEALHRHPLYEFGLKHYTCHEVVDSPTLPRLSTMLDRDGNPHRLHQCRHFVFALKETTAEFVAHSYRMLGVDDTRASAIARAMKAVCPT